LTTFCLSEDRAFDEIGLRMALCSLRRHCPDSPVFVYRSPRQAFVDWLGGFPKVTLIPTSPSGANSWNCKPHSLLPILRGGAQEVVWLDADVLLAGDLRRIFHGWSFDTFGVCEEYRSAPRQGSRPRTEGWGLAIGREFPRTLNSAVLRVTPAHIPLLERWKGLLADPRYAVWQGRPLHERPLYAWGDQDVLNALLGSVEFATLPVRLLRSRRELIHCGSATSYPVGERIDGLLRRIPPVIHTQGEKPWVVFNAASSHGQRV
jgi:hypothetical protein